MKIQIYHNPNWSKSRESVKVLKQEVDSFKIIDYCREGLSVDTINMIIKQLGIKPIDLIRKRDKTFIDLKLSNAQLCNKDFLVNIINKYPKIMERPIILNGKKGVIGRPPENIYKIL